MDPHPLGVARPVPPSPPPSSLTDAVPDPALPVPEVFLSARPPHAPLAMTLILPPRASVAATSIMARLATKSIPTHTCEAGDSSEKVGGGVGSHWRALRVGLRSPEPTAFSSTTMG